MKYQPRHFLSNKLISALAIGSAALLGSACMGEDSLDVANASFAETLDHRWETIDDRYLNLAIDGSMRFEGWLETLAFARDLAKLPAFDYREAPNFTYFVESHHFGSCLSREEIESIGLRSQEGVLESSLEAESIANSNNLMARYANSVCTQYGGAADADQRIRWALAQQALNEGHELASRGMDDTLWYHAGEDATVRSYNNVDYDVLAPLEARRAWRGAYREFSVVMDQRFFTPLKLEGGGWAFPKWNIDDSIRCDPERSNYSAAGPKATDPERDNWLRSKHGMATVNLGDNLREEPALSDTAAPWCVELVPADGDKPAVGVWTQACSQTSDCGDHRVCHDATNNGARGICLPEPHANIQVSVDDLAIGEGGKAWLKEQVGDSFYLFQGGRISEHVLGHSVWNHQFRGLSRHKHAWDYTHLVPMVEFHYEYDTTPGEDPSEAPILPRNIVVTGDDGAEKFPRQQYRFPNLRFEPSRAAFAQTASHTQRWEIQQRKYQRGDVDWPFTPQLMKENLVEVAQHYRAHGTSVPLVWGTAYEASRNYEVDPYWTALKQAVVETAESITDFRLRSFDDMRQAVGHDHRPQGGASD